MGPLIDRILRRCSASGGTPMRRADRFASLSAAGCIRAPEIVRGRSRHRARAAGRRLLRRARAQAGARDDGAAAGAADAGAAGDARHRATAARSTTPSAPTPIASTRCSRSTASARRRTALLVDTHDAARARPIARTPSRWSSAANRAPAAVALDARAQRPTSRRSTRCGGRGARARARRRLRRLDAEATTARGRRRSAEAPRRAALRRRRGRGCARAGRR